MKSEKVVANVERQELLDQTVLVLRKGIQIQVLLEYLAGQNTMSPQAHSRASELVLVAP